MICILVVSAHVGKKIINLPIITDEKVGATLRRKFYGILLKEHPSSKSIKVTEFISSCEEGSQSVAPLFPGKLKRVKRVEIITFTYLDQVRPFLSVHMGV